MLDVKDKPTFMLKLGSRVTKANTASIEAMEESVKRNARSFLILDLKDTSTMDTFALSTLISIRQRLNKYGGDLGIINMTPAIRTLLYLTRTVAVLPGYRNAEHAYKVMMGG